MSILAIWRLAKPFLPTIVGALLIFAVIFGLWRAGYQTGFHKRDAEVASLHKQITDRDAASAKALADNEANVARINALQDQVTKDKNDDAPKQLADARAALRAYILRHQAPASGPGQDHAPRVPDTASKPDDASSAAVVPVADLDACAVAYTTAVGLQDWIRAEASIDRENAK